VLKELIGQIRNETRILVPDLCKPCFPQMNAFADPNVRVGVEVFVRDSVPDPDPLVRGMDLLSSCKNTVIGKALVSIVL